MKRILPLIAAALLLPFFNISAEEASPASVRTREFNLKDFNGISAHSFYKVTLVRDDSFKVSVEFDSALEKYLKVHVSNGVLNLELKELPSSLQKGAKILRATVHMPSLSSLDLSGAASLTAEGRFESRKDFRATLSGASKVKDLNISASKASLDMSGASVCDGFNGRFDRLILHASGAAKPSLTVDAGEWNMELSGAVKANLQGERCRQMSLEMSGAVKTTLAVASDVLRFEGSGASNLNALDAPAQKASVELSGTAKCQVAAEESLTVEASGVSECLYKAPAGASITVDGSGKLAKIRPL